MKLFNAYKHYSEFPVSPGLCFNSSKDLEKLSLVIFQRQEFFLYPFYFPVNYSASSATLVLKLQSSNYILMFVKVTSNLMKLSNADVGRRYLLENKCFIPSYLGSVSHQAQEPRSKRSGFVLRGVLEDLFTHLRNLSVHRSL